MVKSVLVRLLAKAIVITILLLSVISGFAGTASFKLRKLEQEPFARLRSMKKLAEDDMEKGRKAAVEALEIIDQILLTEGGRFFQYKFG